MKEITAVWSDFFNKHLVDTVVKMQSYIIKVSGTSVTLVNFQLDAQNFLFIYIYNTFIKILYMFRAVRCSSSGGLILSVQHLVSSLSAGNCSVHRLAGAQDSHLRRVTTPDAAYIQLDLLKMSSVLLETCRGSLINVLYVNK